MVVLVLLHRLDIDSVGQGSQQTAAHRAASKGNTAALRLLFNPNARFN